MNKAERMIISEKFEAVINAIPEHENGKNPYILSRQTEAFRELMKAL